MDLVFKLVGALGLLLITGGVLTTQPGRRNILFTVGGIGLLVYSIYLKDPVFIPLQLVFILASLHELRKRRHS